MFEAVNEAKRGGAVGTNVIVQDGDTCGIIAFAADDGTDGA